MRKNGATSVFIKPSEKENYDNDEAGVIAKFSKLNVQFYVHIRSREDYT